MLRKTLTILSLLGLLLGVGLWGASYFNIVCYSRKDSFAFTSGRMWWANNPTAGLYAAHRARMVSMRGIIDPVSPTQEGKPNVKELRITIFCGKEGEPRERWSEYDFVASDKYRWSCIGYFDLRTKWTPFASNRRVVIPLWMPTLLLGLLFSLSWLMPHHRRRKRKRLGLCMKCGYDLRGSKDRCPECGEEFGSTIVAR